MYSCPVLVLWDLQLLLMRPPPQTKHHTQPVLSNFCCSSIVIEDKSTSADVERRFCPCEAIVSTKQQKQKESARMRMRAQIENGRWAIWECLENQCQRQQLCPLLRIHCRECEDAENHRIRDVTQVACPPCTVSRLSDDHPAMAVFHFLNKMTLGTLIIYNSQFAKENNTIMNKT